MQKRHYERHGKKGTRPYRIWIHMKDRCNNTRSEQYERYGGRGIKVCDSWMNSFQEFYDWAMSHGYRDDLSLDRINNDLGYFPENCRWATAFVQNNNSRHCRILEFNGERHSISQWALLTGIPRHTISNRVNCYGWPVSAALTIPNGYGKKKERTKRK